MKSKCRVALIRNLLLSFNCNLQWTGFVLHLYLRCVSWYSYAVTICTRMKLLLAFICNFVCFSLGYKVEVIKYIENVDEVELR